jgi:hypothetical protein
MIGKLVRNKYTNKAGIVLRKVVTSKGNFRYHVFMGGKMFSMPIHHLEVL